MRRVMQMVVLLAFFSAVDAFAQCKRCILQPGYGGCYTCGDTVYNASVLCTLLNNGYSCYGQGACEGQMGEQCTNEPCESIKWVGLSPRELKLQGDWQLVSVKVLRAPSTTNKKRPV
jgi:hypothetical protein